MPSVHAHHPLRAVTADIVSLRKLLRRTVQRLESSTSSHARSQIKRQQPFKPASVAIWSDFLSEAQGFLDSGEDNRALEFLRHNVLQSKVRL